MKSGQHPPRPEGEGESPPTEHGPRARGHRDERAKKRERSRELARRSRRADGEVAAADDAPDDDLD